MEESYQNENLGIHVGPSPFLRAASHDVLPRSTSNDPVAMESPAPSNSGELAKRRTHAHKRASSLTDLARCTLTTCTSCHVEGNFPDPHSTCAYSVIICCRAVATSTLGA